MSKDNQLDLMWALIVLLGLCVLVQFFNQERLQDTMRDEIQKVRNK